MEQEEGWGDEGDRSDSEDKDEGERELVGEDFGCASEIGIWEGWWRFEKIEGEEQ